MFFMRDLACSAGDGSPMKKIETAHSQCQSQLKIAVLIVAAGKGERLGGPVPKQYLPLGKAQSILGHTISAFQHCLPEALIQVVIGVGDTYLYEQCIESLPPLLPPVEGGMTRQESVLRGLQALQCAVLESPEPDQAPDIVLIHDGARPFVTKSLINRLLKAVTKNSAAILAVPVVDTLKRQTEGGGIDCTIDRHHLWRAQTPQAFDFEKILSLHQEHKIHASSTPLTDDASLFEAHGFPVQLIPGCDTNFKITTIEDYEKALKMTQEKELPDIRVGHGVDVHATEPGVGIWLMGVFIPAPFQLRGHSDADVGLHSLCDALFGALSDGDIGDHFPPSDPHWKGADSKKFLSYAGQRVKERGGVIRHVDVTILGEQPKVSPYKEKMKQCVADILNLPPQRVSVKATTTERLGFIGREEGLMAMATATVVF